MRRPPWQWWSCALLAPLACDGMATVKRCKALAHDTNPKLEAIEGLTRRRTPATYASASRLYAALARDLDRHLPDAGADAAPDTRGFERGVREYQALLQAGSRQTEGLAQALDAGNAESAALVGRQLDELSRSTKAVVRRIDVACQPE